MKIVVVGYDEDEEQPFWDVISVRGISGSDSDERTTNAKYAAEDRFYRCRGRYAKAVDTLTVDELQEMVRRIEAESEDDAEAAYRALEEGEEA